MKDLLFRLLVARFYRINAGFFLVILIVFFGLMSAKEVVMLHTAIMEAVTGSALFCGISLCVFLLYNFKCIAFCMRELDAPESGFLYNMQGVNSTKQYLLFLQCHTANYLPFLVYGAFTVYIGVSGHNYFLAGVIGAWQLLMCLAGAYICFYKVNFTWKKPMVTLPEYNLFPRKSYSMYLVYYSLYNRKGAFIAIKIFSLLLLQFLVSLNADKVSRENICFVILFVVSAHALLPLYYSRFIEQELSYLRNMPLSLWYRYSVYVITYAIIFIPELLFLLWNEHQVMSIWVIISLYCIAVSRLCLYTSLQYFQKLNTDKYTLLVFALFFVTFMLLATVSLWPFIIAESAISVILFLILYYRFEPANRLVE